MNQIILASVSPRRKQLFELLDIKFKAVDSGYEEVMDERLSHKELVLFLAMGKAKAAAKKYPKAIIFAADTIVSYKGKAIGKPKNKQEARAMLKYFSGRMHNLYTGTVGLNSKTGQVFTNFTESKIYFRKLSQKNIEDYIRLENPYDKAGAYNLQGSGINLIQKIDGDFTNNLGLPMGFVFNSLAEFGVTV